MTQTRETDKLCTTCSPRNAAHAVSAVDVAPQACTGKHLSNTTTVHLLDYLTPGRIRIYIYTYKRSYTYIQRIGYLQSQSPRITAVYGCYHRERMRTHTRPAHDTRTRTSSRQHPSSQHATVAPSDQATLYTTGYSTSLLVHGALGSALAEVRFL